MHHLKRYSKPLLELLSFIFLARFFLHLIRTVFPFLSITGMVSSIFSLFLFGTMGAIIGFTLRKINGNWKWKDLGFTFHSNFLSDILFGLTIFGLFYLLVLPIMLYFIPSMAKGISVSTGMQPVIWLLLGTLGENFLYNLFTGAYHEEIHYRGYMQGFFSKEFALELGILFATIVFSFKHYFDFGWMRVPDTILAGLIFGLIYYGTGSITIPITTHTALAFLIFTPSTIYAYGYKLESYIVALLLGLVSVLLVYLNRHKLRKLLSTIKQLHFIKRWRQSILGILLGLFVFIVMWGSHLLQSLIPSRSVYLVSLLILGLLFALLSIILKTEAR